MGKKNWGFPRVEGKKVNKKQTSAGTGVAALSDRALNEASVKGNDPDLTS